MNWKFLFSIVFEPFIRPTFVSIKSKKSRFISIISKTFLRSGESVKNFLFRSLGGSTTHPIGISYQSDFFPIRIQEKQDKSYSFISSSSESFMKDFQLWRIKAFIAHLNHQNQSFKHLNDCSHSLLEESKKRTNVISNAKKTDRHFEMKMVGIKRKKLNCVLISFLY